MTLKELKIFLPLEQRIEMTVHECDDNFNTIEEYFEGNTIGIPTDFEDFKVAYISASVEGILEITVVKT